MKYLFIILIPITSYSHSFNTLVTNCLAEAVGEPQEGQIEVTRVVLKRIQDKRWPDSVESVIFQKRQFSWVGKRLPEFKEREIRQCQDSVKKALDLGAGEYTHYWAHDLVNPSWTKSAKKITVINKHTFGVL